jgi:hypothetical protein
VQFSLELDTPFGIMIGKSSSASVYFSSSRLLGMVGTGQHRHDALVDTEFLRKVELCQQVNRRFRWRRDVRTWLAKVLGYQIQYGLDIRSAAFHNRQSFPASAPIDFVGRFVERRLAIWAIKYALREAAVSLGVPLNEETFEVLANLAVEAMLTSA